MWRTMVVLAAGVALVGVAACRPRVDQDCVNACEAENACPGADQQPCNDLCAAVPDECAEDHAAYWGCAAANLDQACDSYPACGEQFSRLAVCIDAWCLTHPLDAACYY
ncbi:MAG TPA: hypothetical protein VG389_18440 [Myxococcota bacterium]|nr:hypothetical protein [Myxococcota bacterium]